MRVLRLLLLLTAIAVCTVQQAPHVNAQAKAQLSLQSATTSLQTGQKYPVEIKISGIQDVWLADLELKYDPAYLYIMGTKSGSPIKQGNFFAPAENTIAIGNRVKQDKISYVISMLAPADPVSGDGTIGTFLIYPLAPGKTEIRFNKVDLRKAIFATDNTGDRAVTGSEALPFTPILLQLDITGNKVEPPIEATETPIPTETFTPVAVVGSTSRPGEPTLENATAAPAPTLGTVALPPRNDSSGTLLLSLGLLVVSLLGLLVIVFVWMRSRRRS